MATTDGSPTRDRSDVSDSTSNGKVRHTGLRIALGILSIVIFLFYPLDDRRVAEIEAELEKRRVVSEAL